MKPGRATVATELWQTVAMLADRQPNYPEPIYSGEGHFHAAFGVWPGLPNNSARLSARTV